MLANRIRLIQLTCFSQPLGSTGPNVFHAVLKNNFDWPSPEALLSACPKGLFRLEDVEYEGLRGKAFITMEQAEWLRQHIKLPDLKGLAKTPLLYTNINVPSWKPRVALGKTPAPVIDEKAPPKVQKKQWQDWALRFYKGEVEEPPPLRVSIGRDHELYIFSMRISINYCKGRKVILRAGKEGKTGWLIITKRNDEPMVDCHGKTLDKVVVYEVGIVDPLRFLQAAS
jgi:hypothetical protein